MACVHWISTPKYCDVDVRGCEVCASSSHAAVSRGDRNRRRRKASALVMLANRFLVRGAMLTASIALLWDMLAAWPKEDGGYLNVAQGDVDSCTVSDAYQSKSHWGISHSVQDMCCEVDSTSWFPFNTESCPASRTWPEFPSLESKYGSGLVLRSTGKMQEAPLLLRIVQEITDLCYKLDPKTSLQTSRRMKPPSAHSSRPERDILELMADLQGCVTRLRNVSVTPVVSPWRQRFQPLQTFAERFVPSADEEACGAPEVVEAIAEEEGEPGKWLNFAEAANGARVLAANQEARKPQRAIDGKSDTFLFNKCKANGGMWLVVELSEVTRVKVVELVMRELYSSRIAAFAVFGRLSALGKDLVEYPSTFYTQQWQSLGKFIADDVKGTQQFSVHQGAWIKYFGLHFISHHGPEAACTMNEIKVFGVPPESDLVIYDVPVQDTEPWQTSPEGNSGDADQGSRLVENVVEQDTNSGETTVPTYVGTSIDADADSVRTIGQGEGHLNESHSYTVQGSDDEKSGEQKGESMEAPIVAHQQHETAIQVAVAEETVLEFRSHLDTSFLSGEPPAVAAYKRVRQELQTLKRNTSMVATYVDTMRSGLMDTIDELWMAIARVENKTTALADDLVNVNASVLLMHRRLDELEATVAYNAQAHTKALLGAFGMCFGMGGLLLSCKYYGGYKLVFITVLSIANLTIGGLNFIAVVAPH